jgi:hypothetical protein
MDRPPPDPRKLLDEWMEWERGEATPGRVMANLKTGGIRDLLEVLATQAEAIKKASSSGSSPSAESPGAESSSAESPAGAAESPGGAESPGEDESSAADASPAWVPTV